MQDVYNIHLRLQDVLEIDNMHKRGIPNYPLCTHGAD